MHFSVYLLVFVAILNLLLGAVVYSRNTKLLSSKTFALIAISVAAWSAGLIGFYSFDSKELIIWSMKEFYVSALLLNAAVLAFSGAFTYQKDRSVYVYFPVISWFVMSAPILLLESFLFDISLSESGEVNVMMNSATYPAYLVLILAYFLVSVWTLYRELKVAKLHKKLQIRYVLTGLFIASFFAIIFNGVLPAAGNYNYVWTGPLFTASFVVLVFYSIVKHKLFDIRATIARATAYLASISFILILYAAFIFVLSSASVASSLSVAQRMIFAMVAVFSGLFFQPAKNFFDKITNRIFFRDAYDPQLLTDELNDTLVGGIDLEALLTKSALILQEHLKISFCTFYIRETSYLPARVIGAHRKDPEIDRMDELHKLSPKLHHKVHTAEPNDDTAVERKVTDILRRNDIELMVRLVSTLDYEVEGVGYIFLGTKLSGGIYSEKDTKFLETIGNELVIAIQNVLRFEEIEHFNVTLQKKIDNATGELQTSNKKLLALDEAKDEFVSMASHQLRTPLTSIKGYVSMVLEGDAGEINKTQKQMLGQALFSSQRMVYLISDLLNVSRLRTGKFLIESKPLQLMDIVESEIHQLQEGATAKNITLSLSKPDKLPTVDLDDMKIRQVIMNFIDNAIYYTPQGGKIAVELKNRRSSVEFTVKDSGIGVPKDEQHKLFAKFYRAENARKARPDGTGLGLFMAKKVVVALGGSIIFDSKENKGSTFGFTFPKTKKPTKSDKPKTS